MNGTFMHKAVRGEAGKGKGKGEGGQEATK